MAECKLGLDKLIEAAEKLVAEAAPKEPKAPKVELPADIKELVKTAQAVVGKLRPRRPVEPPEVTTRPVGPAADLNRLIVEAEKNVERGVQEGKPVRDAMPKELADMVEAAQNVTSHWGGAGIGKAIEELMAKKGQTVADAQAMARSMRGLSNAQIARILTDMRGRQQPWYYWVWQQNLISGEITHSRYVLSNYGFSILDRTLAPAMAAIVDTLRGRKNSFFGEPIVGAYSLIRATPDALRASIAAFRSGLRVPLPEEMQLADRMLSRGENLPRDLLHTQAVPYGQPGAPNWGIWQRVLNEGQQEAATRALGIPGRSASAIHAYFKTLNVMASRSARAYREAAKEVSNPLSRQFQDRYDYHYANPTEEAMRGAVNDGYSGTFMDSTGPGWERLAAAVRDSPAKWLFPFMHIPLNIARQTVKYSPVAWLGKNIRANLAGRNGVQAQNLAISKMMVGSSIIGYFIYQGMTGKATGDYPTNSKERNEWKVMGKIPNAVQYGGNWYQLQRFGPVGNMAMLGAEVGQIARHYDKHDDATILDAVGHSIMAAVNLLANEAGLMSLQNLMDVFNEKQSVSQWVAQQAGSFIPFSSFLYQTGSFFDPDARKAKTLLDGLKIRIPFLREQLLPKRDPLYGEPIRNPGYHSIFRQAPVQDADPIKKELDRIGYYPTAPEARIGGVKLTPEQYDRYEATAGPLVKKELTELMSMPIWKMHNNNPDWQRAVAQARVSKARRMAAGAMQVDSLARDGPNNLIEQARQRRLKQMGVPQ